MTSKRPHKVSYCVVKENSVVKKYGIDNDSVTILMGSLVHVNKKISSSFYVIKILSFGATYDETYEHDQWLCSVERLLPVDEVLWPLLEAVSSPIERVDILKNKYRCKELRSIDVGSLVNVYSREDNKLAAPKIGQVHYKGPVAKKGHGTYFGVELLVGYDFFISRHILSRKPFGHSPNFYDDK